jgi:hypothetical protein
MVLFVFIFHFQGIVHTESVAEGQTTDWKFSDTEETDQTCD